MLRRCARRAVGLRRWRGRSRRRSRDEKVGVVVASRARDALAVAARGGLLGEVVEIDLAKGAVVEPVVAHPAIDHGALGRGDFERGMRIEQRHDDGEAFVGGADHADLPLDSGTFFTSQSMVS